MDELSFGRPQGDIPPDKKLVERTLAGDSEAFALLHKRYFGRVYRVALMRVRSAQDAEDIASETFVRAITHLKSFRFQGESIFPWLSRIAANLAADQGRRAAGLPVVSLDTPTADGVRALLEALPGAPDPFELADRNETQQLVRAAVAALPADQSEAILMRFGSDMPLKEIAAAMGRTEGAIKSLLHRALVNLRKSLVSGVQDAEAFGQRRAAQHNVAPTTTTNTATNSTTDSNTRRYGPYDI